MKYIGILLRCNDNKYLLNDDVISIFNDKVIPLGIFVDNIYSYNLIDMCSGIIVPGGDNINNRELELIKYIYDKNIPCFGICLGMQEMGYLFNGRMNEVSNYSHKVENNKYAHSILINKKSKLYEIIGSEEIKVNSRHKDYLVNTDLFISSISDVIESVEDNNKKFFIGVQWHPESMYSYDNNNKKLIDYFINICLNSK